MPEYQYIKFLQIGWTAYSAVGKFGHSLFILQRNILGRASLKLSNNFVQYRQNTFGHFCRHVYYICTNMRSWQIWKAS